MPDTSKPRGGRATGGASRPTPLLDAIRSGELIPTFEQLVLAGQELEPLEALAYHNGDQARRCVSPLIERYRDRDGKVVELTRPKGMAGVAYIRVSTASQRSGTRDVGKPDLGEAEEGRTRAEMRGRDLDTAYSEEEQIDRTIAHFIKQGEAFYIVSDAGLSGAWPWNDEKLIRRMYERRAERYHEAYRRIILEDERFADQRERAQAYLDARVEQKVATVETLSEQFVSRFIRPGREASRARARTPKYRPGLWWIIRCLPEIHTIATSDLSRLFRSYDVQIEFGNELMERGRGCRIVGTYEPLDFLNRSVTSAGSGMGDTLLGAALGVGAEQHLWSVLTGSIKGQVRRLMAGRPLNCDAAWLKRERSGAYSVRPEAAATVLRAVELLEEGYGQRRVQSTLLAEKAAGTPHEIPLSDNTIPRWARNPLLVGDQEVYGLLWQGVIPPILVDADGRPDRYRFERLVKNLDERGADNPNRLTPPDERITHLGAGTARCVCGKVLHHKQACGPQKIKLKGGVIKVYPPSFAYACTCSPASRAKNPAVHHIQLSESNYHAFLDALVFQRIEWILRALEQSRERDVLADRVRQMEVDARERHRALQTRRNSDDTKLAARAKAEAAAGATGDVVDEEAVRYWMTRLLRGEEEALRQVEERLERSRGELRAYALPTHIEQLRRQFDRAAAGELDARQRNRLVRDLLRIEFVEDADTPLECRLYWAVASRRYTTVPLDVKVNKKGARTIRLPEDADWILGKFGA